MVKLLVDMSTQEISTVPITDDESFLGGRALIARTAVNEIPPNCDPLGPDNSLIIAPGLFAGAGIPSALRLSLGGKSPLTGGIKESNAGGTSALALASAGLKSVVITGRPKPGSCFILEIKDMTARLISASELAGRGTYDTAKYLKSRFGDNTAALIIGPAGENLALAACVLNLDYQYRPSRANGRGGMGAVMGSKGLKAIVIHPGTDLTLSESLEPRPEIASLVSQYCQAIKDNPNTQDYNQYGTALTGDIADSLGCLPTQNFRRGSFEGKDKILGKTVRTTILARGGAGNPTHSCVPDCLISCSNVFPDATGKELVSPLDYEAIASIGSNLCISDLDGIAKLYWHCNNLGIDVIEAGASLALMMDEGLIPWGDSAKALGLLQTGYHQEYPGYLIANGLVTTAKHLNVHRVAAVKGQAFAAFDPRSVKGLGVTYATSPQGADHTAGHTIRKKIDHHKSEGQIDLSISLQVETTLYDILGVCFFAIASLSGNEKTVSQIYSAITGSDWDYDQLKGLARQTLALEKKFNLAAGLDETQDTLPEFIYQERLPPHNTVFDISPEILKEAGKKLGRQQATFVT